MFASIANRSLVSIARVVVFGEKNVFSLPHNLHLGISTYLPSKTRKGESILVTPTLGSLVLLHRTHTKIKHKYFITYDTKLNNNYAEDLTRKRSMSTNESERE